MSIDNHEEGRKQRGATADQRRVRAAVPAVMKAWEGLTDEERLVWDVQGSNRRMKGISYFKKVNLRRFLLGQALLRVPPESRPYDPRPLLKGVDIRNREGRITIELELSRKPDAPRTVWASRPCNLGVKKPRRCPRLGWLPPLKGRWVEITAPYFKKHGDYIKQHSLQLVGKRIFVRLRLETDDGANLYEQVRAVVPKPEVQIAGKAPSPSKVHRRSIEGPSKTLRSIKTAPRQRRAIAPLGPKGRGRKAGV
jgi:hypothetical protein